MILTTQLEEEIRAAVSNDNESSARYVPNAHVKALLKEIDALRYDASKKFVYPATTYISTDSETYNAGRSEGNADVAAELRKIIDPEDKKHLNLPGLLKQVEWLVEYKKQAHQAISYIYEECSIKVPDYTDDYDAPSIDELLRECYYLGEGYKDNIK